MNCLNAPTITDWIMVLVTIVYVIATVFIFKANKKSAKAAEDQLQDTKDQMETSKAQFEEQLAETKRQYEETKRLSVMPYFQCEKDISNTYLFSKELFLDAKERHGSHYHDIVRIKNIGLGTAKNIEARWTILSGVQEKEPFVFQSAITGEGQLVGFDFIIPSNCISQRNDFSVSLDLFFSDLINTQYSQRIEFRFIKDNNRITIQHTTDNVNHIIGANNA